MKPSNLDIKLPKIESQPRYRKRSKSGSRECKIAQKSLKIEEFPPKICSFKVEEIDQKRTLTINAFWGEFTIGIANDAPEGYVEKMFSRFWDERIALALQKNKAAHLKIKEDENELLCKEDIVLFELKENHHLILRASGENFNIGSGDTFFVYRVKDLISSEEFALAIHIFPGEKLLGEKADLLREFINDETLVGSIVKNASEIKAEGESENLAVRELYIAPLAEHGTIKNLEPCKTLEDALLRSLELLNQIEQLHLDGYVHGDLNFGNVLVIRPSPPIFMFIDLDSLEKKSEEVATIQEEFDDAIREVEDDDPSDSNLTKDFEDAFELVNDFFEEAKKTQKRNLVFDEIYNNVQEISQQFQSDPCRSKIESSGFGQDRKFRS